MDVTNPAVEQSQYLTFLVAGEEYAVGILQAKEIIQYDTVTRVPKTPAWVRGVINLRGGVVPVVDLAARFGLGKTQPGRETCIVITELDLDGGQMLLGVLADSVSRVIDLRPEEIDPPPAFGTQVQVDYLQGLGKVEGRFVLLLDIEKVLSAEDLMADETEATSAGGGEGAPVAGAPGLAAPGSEPTSELELTA